jgi:hypothetical protein
MASRPVEERQCFGELDESAKMPSRYWIKVKNSRYSQLEGELFGRA